MTKEKRYKQSLKDKGIANVLVPIPDTKKDRIAIHSEAKKLRINAGKTLKNDEVK